MLKKERENIYISDTALSCLPSSILLSSISNLSRLCGLDLDTQIQKPCLLCVTWILWPLRNLSEIHCNIRSLQANFNNLANTACWLKMHFLYYRAIWNQISKGRIFSWTSPYLVILFTIKSLHTPLIGGVGMYIKIN